MNRRALTLPSILAIVALSLAACSEATNESVTSRVEEKTFTLQPATVPVSVGFLTGQLTELKVVEQVDVDTKEVVQPPRLQGTLQLKNETSDQTARLLSGSLEFLDKDGKPIPLASGREAPRFTFYSYSSERLDPGMQTSHTVDVSFPAAALDGTPLADLRVKITYIPDPYRAESDTVPVTVAGGA